MAVEAWSGLLFHGSWDIPRASLPSSPIVQGRRCVIYFAEDSPGGFEGWIGGDGVVRFRYRRCGLLWWSSLPHPLEEAWRQRVCLSEIYFLDGFLRVQERGTCPEHVCTSVSYIKERVTPGRAFRGPDIESLKLLCRDVLRP